MFAYFVEESKKLEKEVEEELREEEEALRQYEEEEALKKSGAAAPTMASLSSAAPAAAEEEMASSSAAPDKVMLEMNSLLSSVPPEVWGRLAGEVSVGNVTQLFNCVTLMAGYLGFNSDTPLSNIFMAINGGELTRFKVVGAFAKARSEMDPSNGNTAIQLLHMFMTMSEEPAGITSERLMSMIQAGPQPEEQTKESAEAAPEAMSQM
jgi:hypothetical protein